MELYKYDVDLPFSIHLKNGFEEVGEWKRNDALAGVYRRGLEEVGRLLSGAQTAPT
jgi:hypothetical protein